MNEGELVVRVPCPKQCVCDADVIPIGSIGKFTGHSNLTMSSTGKTELYSLIAWTVGMKIKKWWTYEHAFTRYNLGDVDDSDGLYLELPDEPIGYYS